MTLSNQLQDLLNIDNIHFEQMVYRIYSDVLQLSKANASDIEAAFLDLNLSIMLYSFFKKYMKNGMILILLISCSLLAMPLGVSLMVLYILRDFENASSLISSPEPKAHKVSS